MVNPPLNLHEYELAARELLPRVSFEFISRGAEDEITLNANRTAFAQWRIVPRYLTGVDSPNLATRVLDHEISMPVMVAPMGLHCLAHEQGEIASATATQRAGTVYGTGVAASKSVDEIAAVAGLWWFQTYVLQDRGLTLEVIRRAEHAGASALVVTVDVCVRGNREADMRNGFEIPPGMSMPNLLASGVDGDAPSYSSLTTWERAITWRDIDWLASQSSLPIVIKGLLSPEDAVLATEHGARGIIVSNHGGRQLDSAIATIDALPLIADVVRDRTEIYLDGGVRRGADVIKALALGARAVLIGRPILYGLAVDGEEGVLRVLDLIRRELTTAMILSGANDVRCLPRGIVVPAGPRLPGFHV